MDLGDLLTLDEAAPVIGVSTARLRQRLTDGEMLGVKRAGAWFVPSLEVKRWADLPRAGHRPWSAARSWSALADLAGDPAQPPDHDLAARLHRRAVRRPLYVHPGLVERAAPSDGVLFSGIEAIEGHGLLGDYPVRDLYVAREVANDLVERLGAQSASTAVNLILRVVDDIGAVPTVGGTELVVGPVAALDLMEGYDARVRAVGRELWSRQNSTR